MGVAAASWTRARLLRLAGWAAGRSLTPGSLAGISVLLGVCSAVWFSGGTEEDILAGAGVLAGWFLAQGTARCLAASFAQDQAAGAGSFAWLDALCVAVAELAIYCSIAVAGQTRSGNGLWPLAMLTITSVSLAEMIGRCASEVVHTAADWLDSLSPALRQVIRVMQAPGAGARVLIAVVILAAAGPRWSLLAVLVVESISICVTIGLYVAATGTPHPDDREEPDVVIACRDDGPVARWAGRLVQGNLIPLPPAVAGVTATGLLALLGLKGLRGVIALTPPVVMTLAAPGSSHPHDRRFDWVVPALLELGQFIYIAALGFALKVPGPVIYALCAFTALWYLSLGVSATEATGRAMPAGPGSGIGWAARMFVIGLAAIFGIATFGYLGLAAYLGVLICRRVLIGYLIPGEEDSP